MRKGFIIFTNLIISLIIMVAVLLTSIYVQTKIYDFPPATPFSGDSLINPYQNTDKYNVKCNLHAHSIAWGGLTNGHDTPENITRAYGDKGYDVAGVSNYHSVLDSAKSKSKVYVPVYEHGINIFKSHKLSIGSKEVSYFDFPLWQNTSQKQQIVNDIRDNGGLVCINHPKFINGHTFDDLAQMTNYQFIEVLNHYRISDEYWDAALTAGRLVYGLGNDDTHDINKEPTFKMWTEVYIDTLSTENVLESLKKGQSYAVHAESGEADIEFARIKVENDTLFMRIWGRDLRKLQFYSANHTLIDSILYEPTPSEPSVMFLREMYWPYPKGLPYVRIVAKSDKCTLYLNPIVRSKDGKTAGIGNAQATVNQTLTWLYRLVVLVIMGFMLFLFLRLWKIRLFKR